MYLGDWRISADERVKYDSYFQQCAPVQGYVTGTIKCIFSLTNSGLFKVIKHEIFLLNPVYLEIFFVKSGRYRFNRYLLIDFYSFRDLSDITTDGRLDKREFTIACHLISSQVNSIPQLCFFSILTFLFLFERFKKNVHSHKTFLPPFFPMQ